MTDRVALAEQTLLLDLVELRSAVLALVSLLSEHTRTDANVIMSRLVQEMSAQDFVRHGCGRIIPAKPGVCWPCMERDRASVPRVYFGTEKEYVPHEWER